MNDQHPEQHPEQPPGQEPAHAPDESTDSTPPDDLTLEQLEEHISAAEARHQELSARLDATGADER